jgi:predicted RNA-binding Zn ribbon-like protein
MARDAAYQFEFSGGELCLDYANTMGNRPEGREEHLGGWTDLVAWASQAGLLSARERATLRALAARDATAAARDFDRAVALRETNYRLFAAIAAGRPPARRDVAALNDALAGAMRHARIEPAAGGAFVWGWADGDPSVDRLLWPIVRSAAELLVSPRRSDVRECASGACSWLFLDRSPARKRRWCSMKTCGNRDKVRRFYARRRIS